MHLVLLNQYYPPDEAPTGLMLEAVAAELASAGHKVTIICAGGGYAGGGGDPSRSMAGLANVEIRRIKATRFGRRSSLAKLADYASYYLGVARVLATVRPAPDRVVAMTTPPYLSVLARLMSRFRGGDHSHWVMDLYPDVMVAHGMLREGGVAWRGLAALARWGFGGGRCSAVVTLGPDMSERIDRHLSSGIRSSWVPLWGTDGDEERDGDSHREDRLEVEAQQLRRQRGWSDDELVLMYSGNMGLGHRFGEFLAAALRAGESPRPLRFVFYGGGKRRREVEDFIRQHPDAPVELHDYVPRHQLAAHLRTADIHLASLEASWTGTMLPSKLQGVFAAGRPVIFVGGADSSTARWIEESGAGRVVPPGDDGRGIVNLGGFDPVECGRRALLFSKREFSKDRNASAIAARFAVPAQ